MHLCMLYMWCGSVDCLVRWGECQEHYLLDMLDYFQGLCSLEQTGLVKGVGCVSVVSDSPPDIRHHNTTWFDAP